MLRNLFLGLSVVAVAASGPAPLKIAKLDLEKIDERQLFSELSDHLPLLYPYLSRIEIDYSTLFYDQLRPAYSVSETKNSLVVEAKVGVRFAAKATDPIEGHSRYVNYRCVVAFQLGHKFNWGPIPEVLDCDVEASDY